jgi:hypothetical protein
MKFTLREVAMLFEELNGKVINPETGEKSKGLLSQKLSIKAKYILNNQVNKQLIDEIKTFEESRLEVFKEMVADGKGDEKDNQFIIHPENQLELVNKLNDLQSIEKNIEVPNLNVNELFSIETEDYYPILLEKLLKKEEE